MALAEQVILERGEDGRERPGGMVEIEE